MVLAIYMAIIAGVTAGLAAQGVAAEREVRVTHGPRGRVLTNIGVWSPDSQWLLYDTRSDAEGAVFDGTRIELVNINSGEVRQVYESTRGAGCGVATFQPRAWRVAFILGPEHPAPDWLYGPSHRQGVIVEVGADKPAVPLDARDLLPPFTPGALRGGSHVHVWDPAGEWISFTYEDHLLAKFAGPGPGRDLNQRNVGVSVPGHPVTVAKGHPRNQDGTHFTVLVTRTVSEPRPGSDEIKKACEEGWVGTNGYLRPDGTRQRHALAFQGQVVTARGETRSEVFIADLPEDLTQPGEGPLAGTETRLPKPPRGVVQRRLTFTAEQPFPGIQGPRHWLRASPDGARIAFLMKDRAGIAQLWTVSPVGGPPVMLTRNPWPVASTFTWSPDGRRIAHVMDNSVCVTDAATGETTRLTPRRDDASAPRPEACVFSPDGAKIAYVRRLAEAGGACNQIFYALAP
jgi:hypothetical protein